MGIGGGNPAGNGNPGDYVGSYGNAMIIP